MRLTILALLVLASLSSWARISPSLLDRTRSVTGFGDIRYRAPLSGSTGSPIVLMHGIYGGASHRAFRQLLPLLDAAGAAVYILDLPGAGESAKPRKRYSIADLDAFVEAFLAEVVQRRATLVTESLTGTSGLKVAGKRPDLVRRLILLSPTGINSLAQPPSVREERLFERLWNDDTALIAFYENLLNDNSLRFFLRFAFSNDALIDDDILNDSRAMRTNLDQRFLTLSFVAGQFYRSFAESSADVFVPVLGVFGADYEPFQETPPSTASDFRAIRPNFDYIELPNCGSSVQREAPAALAREILIFAEED